MIHLIADQFHRCFGVLLFLLYAYQFFYLIVPLLFRRKAAPPPAAPRRMAVLVAARNEAAVIGQLLDSINAQTYPADKRAVFVVADNCTDDTAAVAAAHGATVFERHNTRQVGKGYALDYLLHSMAAGETDFDAYLVLDADNLLSPDYLEQMNRTLAQGYPIVTGYRASKNYGDNWISAGYGLWFLRESQQLNRPRHRLGTGCFVSGTGFAFTADILRRQGGGWPYHLLTEDLEFTAVHLAAGDSIGYCEGAILYDEQPTRFSQSWRQRMRWAKGFLQVLRQEGNSLLAGIRRGSFACFDMIASMFPAVALTVAELLVCGAEIAALLIAGESPLPALLSLARMAAGVGGTLYLLGGVTLLTEWKRIPTPGWKKLLYYLLFPLFMLTYVPIAVTALFRPVEWKPVAHTRAMTLHELAAEKNR